MGADTQCPTSHFFCFPWGFHTGSSQAPGWGQTILHDLFPPSPLLPFVIPVHSTGVFYQGTGTAWISHPFSWLCGAGQNGEVIPLAMLIPGA